MGAPSGRPLSLPWARVALGTVASVGVAVVLHVVAPAAAADADPTVTVTAPPGLVAVGDRITVELEHWGLGTVTVGVCGNGARRGSQDCALAGDQGVAIRGPGRTPVDLVVMAPPLPCPCVVRASTPAGDTVRTIPLEILGLPVEPTVLGATATTATPGLQVRARVVPKQESWPDSWIPAFGGPTQRVLLLTLRNRSGGPITGVRVVAAVGRDRANAEPIASVSVGKLAAGATATVRVPVELLAPAWGEYHVFGTVYGPARPVEFSAETTNEPWGLELLLPLLLLVWARIARRRERSRTAAEATLVTATSAHALLQESSPRVGPSDDGRWESPAYDPVRGEHEIDLLGDGVDPDRVVTASAART
jgi:hypothetical protein